MKNNPTISPFYDNDVLLDYLHDRLPEDARKAFEAALSHDEMLQDAVAGLKNDTHLTQIPSLKSNLELFLNEQTKSTTAKEKTKRPIGFPILWLSIGILLILLVLVGIYMYIVHL